MEKENTNYKKEYESLLLENEKLMKRIEELEVNLKKYTNPNRNKEYYHRNKKEICEKRKGYNITPIPQEKKREYNKKYYEKKKKERLEKNSK